MIPVRNPVAAGEYEVLIVEITFRETARGMGYGLCRCIIQDTGEYEGRVVFYAYTSRNYVKGLPGHPREIPFWKPRHAIVKIKHENKSGTIYPNSHTMVLI